MAQTAAIYVTANSLIDQNTSLEDAMKIAEAAGADGFEMRRELLPSTIQISELQSLGERLKVFPSPPAYSVPRPLFEGGRLEQAALLKRLREAQALGCQLVKFSPLGMEAGESEIAALTALLSNWKQEAPDMRVMVENDQTTASGQLTQWVRFFEQATAAGCPISMTFDLGNWDSVGVDVTEAARALGRFVSYIHGKGVERVGAQWAARPIHATTTPHPALEYLPATAPRAIEFPIPGSEQEERIKALRSYVLLLRSGTFETRATI